jgi:hypothetical protein
VGEGHPTISFPSLVALVQPQVYTPGWWGWIEEARAKHNGRDECL